MLILSLLNKTEPNNIAELVESLLQEPPVVDHPLLNMLQAFFESADPNNYGRQYFRELPKGMPAKGSISSRSAYGITSPRCRTLRRLRSRWESSPSSHGCMRFRTGPCPISAGRKEP